MKSESFANVPGDLVVAVDNVHEAHRCQRQKRNAGDAGKDQLDKCVTSFHGKQLGFGDRIILTLSAASRRR
jgi:hypothetical protein